MAVPIYIPKLGMTMSEATIVDWKVAEGDFLEKDSIALTIETEKVIWDIPADASGFLHILAENGSIVEVGKIVGQIAETKEELQVLQKEGTIDREIIGEPSPIESLQTEAETEITDSTKPKVSAPASPAARRMAKKLGIDLSLVSGSGTDGRIKEKDVIRYSEKAEPLRKITPLAKKMAEDAGINTNALRGSGDSGKITSQDIKSIIEDEKKDVFSTGRVKKIPMTTLRKSIASSLYNSVHNTARAQQFADVDVTDLLKFYEQIRTKYNNEESVKVSLTDLMILITCCALKRVPLMNSMFVNNEFLVYEDIHMGVAVALPDGGLIVPILRNAGQKGLLEIARERKMLVEKAREGELTLDDVAQGTYTISNMNMFSIDGGVPVMRSPQNGILVLGRIKERPAVYQNEIVIRSIMVLSHAFDHQIIDGVSAAQFLGCVMEYMENPTFMLL